MAEGSLPFAGGGVIFVTGDSSIAVSVSASSGVTLIFFLTLPLRVSHLLSAGQLV